VSFSVGTPASSATGDVEHREVEGQSQKIATEGFDEEFVDCVTGFNRHPTNDRGSGLVSRQVIAGDAVIGVVIADRVEEGL